MPPKPPPPPPRVVTLVLVTPAGSLQGALPPLPVATPWWQDAEPIVRAARSTYGVEPTVLRLLATGSPTPHGGETTYLAELPEREAARLPLRPWTGSLEDDALRMPWARPGGPSADLAWATDALHGIGMGLDGPAIQVRTWNLSSLWRVPAGGQTVWLKVVPPFFAHEGRLIEHLGDGAVPRLLAHDGPRILLAEIPGDDLYDAELPALRSMVTALVALQRAHIGDVATLLELGLPDRRSAPLGATIAAVVERTASEVDAPDRATLARFVDEIDERLAGVGACGLPDTLVHGDFHPGNTRGIPPSITVLDWGDSGVGHPLLDEPAFLDRIAAKDVGPIRDHWHGAWRAAVPGSDPERAASLLRPVATALQAAQYRMFLDRIEPSERPYHAADPAERLRLTASQLRG